MCEVSSMLSVRDWMIKKVYTVYEEQSALAAVRKMSKYAVGDLPVVKKNRVLVGIVTERDLIKKVFVERRDSSKVKVRDIMSTNLVSIKPTESIFEAARIMDIHHIKQTPVVARKKLVGLISLSDIMKRMIAD